MKYDAVVRFVNTYYKKSLITINNIHIWDKKLLYKNKIYIVRQHVFTLI